MGLGPQQRKQFQQFTLFCICVLYMFVHEFCRRHSRSSLNNSGPGGTDRPFGRLSLSQPGRRVGNCQERISGIRNFRPGRCAWKRIHPRSVDTEVAGAKPRHLSVNTSRGDTFTGAPPGTKVADSGDTFLAVPHATARMGKRKSPEGPIGSFWRSS